MLRCLSLLVLLTWIPWADAADLRVGFAEIDISPKIDAKKPVYIAGYGKDRKATKVHDPIMARAIVLVDGDRKVAIVCADLVGLFFNSVERIRAELPGYQAITISSTHNHEGPDTMGLWGPNAFTSGVDPEYLTFVEKEIVRAVREASKNPLPAKAVIGKTRMPELLTDTRKPIVLHDELVALRFEGDSGKTLGVVVQWNCHPETLDDENTELSSDFVAATVAEIKAKYSCPVVYLTGTVGGLMTSLRVPIKNEAGVELKDGTFEKTDLYGKRLGQGAIRALDKAEPITLTPFDTRSQAIVLPVENKLYQLGWQLGVFKRDIVEWHGDPFTTKPIPAKDLKKPAGVRSEVGFWKLGELGIAIIPGEIYPELVLDQVQNPVDPGADHPDAPLEPAIYPQMKTKHRMLIGLGNDELGYLLPKRQWDEAPPYTYGAKKAPYGEVNSLGVSAGPIICEAFQKLTK